MKIFSYDGLDEGTSLHHTLLEVWCYRADSLHPPHSRRRRRQGRPVISPRSFARSPRPSLHSRTFCFLPSTLTLPPPAFHLPWLS